MKTRFYKMKTSLRASNVNLNQIGFDFSKLRYLDLNKDRQKESAPEYEPRRSRLYTEFIIPSRVCGYERRRKEPYQLNRGFSYRQNAA